MTHSFSLLQGQGLGLCPGSTESAVLGTESSFSVQVHPNETTKALSFPNPEGLANTPWNRRVVPPCGLSFDQWKPGVGEVYNRFIAAPSQPQCSRCGGFLQPLQNPSLPRNQLCSLKKLQKLKNAPPCICFPFFLMFFLSSFNITFLELSIPKILARKFILVIFSRAPRRRHYISTIVRRPSLVFLLSFFINYSTLYLQPVLQEIEIDFIMR